MKKILSQYFYFIMSLVIPAVVIYGFSHTVGINLLHASPPRPLLLWCHGIAFSGWLVFFIVQSGLVRMRKVSVHRTLGWFGLALGLVMIGLGYITAVTMAKFHLLYPGPLGDPVAFLVVPLHDITTFAVFFLLAIWYRKRPELHRRFIFIASCTLTAAAWGRFPQWPGVDWFYWGVIFLITLGALRDLAVMKRVHPIYLWALPVLIVTQNLTLYIKDHHPAPWMAFAHFLMR